MAANSPTPPDAPQMLLCPITKELLVDPVVAADGHTYERSAIEKWLTKRESSPMTNEPVRTRPALPPPTSSPCFPLPFCHI